MQHGRASKRWPVYMSRCSAAILASAFALSAAGAAWPQGILSVQLVGNFNGVSCEPEDPANDMRLVGDNVWRKLVFVNQPGSPDTVFFKFTKNGSYLPLHWGWSGVWGVAALAWSPPSIAAILPDSGYHYFYFNDVDYSYRIEQPAGCITGTMAAAGSGGVPPGASVTLFDSLYNVIGTFAAWSDDSYRFGGLCASVYGLSASAPGYRDTTIAEILLQAGETRDIPIRLTPLVGVLFSSVECRRVEGGVMVTWCTMGCTPLAAFDVYRGREPAFQTASKRNSIPVLADRIYEFFDLCDDPSQDLYYHIVEAGGDNPARCGPIFVKGEALAACLGQNYPNPFNPSTVIPFTVSATGAGKRATISFYDASGRLIDRYDLGTKEAGSHSFRWNPMAASRGSVPSGVYYCRLAVGKEVFSRKLVLLR